LEIKMAEERPMPVSRGVRHDVLGGRLAATTALTPKEIIGILRRHTLLIIAMTIAGLLVGGGTWFALRKYFPRYTAMTYIEVLPPVETDPMMIIAVQLQKDILYGYRLSMASLIKEQRTLQELIARDKVKETDWFNRRDKNIRKAVKDLGKQFGAFAHRDGDFVEISMTCRSDKEAALIVNEMLDLFLASQGGTKKEEIAGRLARLEDQRVRVQRDLVVANQALDELRTATGITDLDKPIGRYFQHTITLKLNDLELRKNELNMMISQLQANITNLERLATGPVTEQIERIVEADPVMVLLAQQKALLESQLAGMLTKFGENHRVARQMQELIDEIKAKRELRKAEIAEQTRVANLGDGRDTLVVLQERFNELEKLRQDADAKQKDLEMARVAYEQRVVIRDERVAMVDSIKEQVEKLKILHDDPLTPKVRAVGYAPVPLEMVAARQWWVWFPSGTILGFLLSVALTFLMELSNDLVRAPRDVGRYLHIPLLGVVPDAAEDDQVRGINLAHAVREAPYSIISESYRRCRTNLKLSGAIESLKALLVSSGMAGDGVTSVAVNLATAFVAEDKKVLLIDANFRHSSLRALFPQGGGEAEQFDFGLSSVLMNQCSVKEATRVSGIAGLDVIGSGPLPGNPAELLGSGRMQDLVKEQRKVYDYVIIDGPPVLLVSDSKSMAKFVDATLLVFNAAATRRGAAQRAINEIKEVGGTIVGCVLFGVRAMKGGYFQEQFKSYQEYQKMQLAGSA
jgi:capsular exopolysaccharide synthesis family protein